MSIECQTISTPKEASTAEIVCVDLGERTHDHDTMIKHSGELKANTLI